MLICDNLHFSHGDKKILKGVSFELAEGQNLLIIGENGAGKSTLAKLLCGVLDGKGHISLFGQDSRRITPKERAKLIGYVAPKLSSFDEDITLLDYLLMGRFVYKNKFEPYTKEEIDEARGLLARFSLESLADTRLTSLSSGEKQLAMTLQAALQNSRLTIFDEPIANVDSARSHELFGLLASNEIFQNKIVITHDLHFAFSLGFDILYLKGGVAEFFGSSAEFFDETSLFHRFGGTVRKNDMGVFADYAKI